MRLTGVVLLPVVTEASVRSENAEVTTIRAIMVATTMSSFRRDFGLWLANCYFSSHRACNIVTLGRKS